MIVPILYLPGTGGHFLMHFITNAKLNVNTVMKISKHGNAHDTASEIYVPDGFDKWDTATKIKSMLNLEVPNASSTYYCACHINELDELLPHFDKIIRICIDIDDVDEIAHSYFGKWFIDRKEFKSDLSDIPRIKHKIFTKINSYNGLVRLFNNRIDPKVLNLSWKELVHEDASILMEKISMFTSINVNQFNMENLLNWRVATINGIEEIRELVNVAK